MLKYVRYVPVVVAIIITLAYVPHAYATSADVMLVQIQAGGDSAATQELIAIYNNSSEPVDVADYCFLNKSGKEVACLTTSAPDEALYLPGWSFAVAVSSSFADFVGLPADTFTVIFEPLSQSSGSITGSSDTITLVNKDGDPVDQHSWSETLPGGMLFVRLSAADYQPYFFDSDMASDWSIQNSEYVPIDQTYSVIVEQSDLCPNIEGQQPTPPINTIVNAEGDCVAEELVDEALVVPLRITELLPNVAGSDSGREFIEFYNPNDHSVNLANYTLLIGPQFEHQFILPDLSIAPGSYYALSNVEVRYSLLNSSSRVRLQAGDQVVSETPAYQDPKDGAAWALFEGNWQYVAEPTPGAANTIGPVATILVANASKSKPTTSSLKACNANQYRSPETNHCRLIATNTSRPKPCAANQARNPETGRCRLIVQDTGPTPCKEGQERNPETNRCRTVTKAPSADFAVLDAETKQDANAWYVWIAVGLAVVAALAYAAWEWRREVGLIFGRLRRMVLKR